MKKTLKIWLLLGALATAVTSQNTHDSDHHLAQDAHYDSDEKSYRQDVLSSNRRHQNLRSYEPVSYDDEPSADHKNYQSLEPTYYKQEPEPYPHVARYHVVPQQIEYRHPEDPSYHRPQEIVYHQSPQQYQEVPPEHREAYARSTHHLQPEVKEDPKYITTTHEEPKYVHQPARPAVRHPAPVPTDPKLPLYFTMYEKRVIQDPVDKYGKGPWRYLTYGHGITYGSKEPGKVFEKGYGYIRALGRDHCKLPEHLCPPRDDKPFDYEGRKEPYFGYRPH